MDCKDVDERLPWLLNGSLTTSEADEVRAHVAGCDRCRAELAETRGAYAVFGAHLPASAILDLAWDRPPDGVEAALARAHLEACRECGEELDLARESRRLEALPAPPNVTVAPSPPARWTPLRILLPSALAAGLLAGFVLGARRPVPSLPPDEGRIVRLERETERLRGLVASLESAARTARPRLNLPLFELMPALVRRGAADQATELTIPPASTEVALLLSVEGPPGTTASLRVTDAAGQEVWATDGLVSGPPGGYVVTLPVEMLPAGPYVMTLHPQAGAPVEYRVRVRR